MRALRVWLGPEPTEALEAAVRHAEATLVDFEEANVVVWASYEAGPDELAPLLHDGVELVQVDSAGVEHWLESGLVDERRIWAGAQGAFARELAEHALTLLLAAVKRLPRAAHAARWGEVEGRTIRDKTVGVVGAGGIGSRLVALLGPLGARTLALTRSGRPVAGADRSVGPDDLQGLLTASSFVVLAAPLTPATRGLIGAAELDLLGPDGWLVNVARGALVDTDALVEALSAGRLGGACLDVTEPEPLPEGHPLWSLPNVLVTPHAPMAWPERDAPLAARVEENLRRFRAGLPLLGTIEVERGY